MRPLRTVFVAPQPPYPLTNGLPIRLFQLLRAYAECGPVKLVFLYQNKAQLEAVDAVAGFCESLHPVPATSTHGETALAGLPRWRRRLRLACARRPVAMMKEFSPEMSRIVEELTPSADLVHVTTIHMVVQIERLLARRRAGPRFVLDLPDVETARHASALRVTPLKSWPQIALGYYEVLRLWAYQRQAIRWFDRVLVCSERERERLGAPNVVVVPNAMTVPPNLESSEIDGRTMLFCGTLSYPPNVDGLEFFVHQILPEIRSEIPNARLVIVGRTPIPRVRALDDGVTVRVEADVRSVADYYRRATLAVVPLRWGGGTRIKILEAWALGVPVVSTPLGCEGLDATDGEHLAIAASPAKFARACVELLRTPAQRQRLIERGRDLVWRKYRREAVQSQVVALARELADESARSERRPERMVVGTWPR
jgi:glycosyltransferase involved in cell wall biosynthesis